jgi:hypothetical protein
MNVIATRTLELLEKPPIEIPIRIFMPQAGDGSWSCSYEIAWPGEKAVSAAAGSIPFRQSSSPSKKSAAMSIRASIHKMGRLTCGPERVTASCPEQCSLFTYRG